jgi:adenylate/nucleoside-diphosphate kinase
MEDSISFMEQALG